MEQELNEQTLERINDYPRFDECSIQTFNDQNKEDKCQSRILEMSIDNLKKCVKLQSMLPYWIFFSVNPMENWKRNRESIKAIQTWICDIDTGTKLTPYIGAGIGYAKLEVEKRLELLREFVPKINNWGTCDIVCSNLKFIKQNKELVWEFIQPYLKSNKEFEIRFGVVILLNYFIEDEYIDRVLLILEKIKHEGYYAKMAVAWALSVCFVKYWDKTLEYFTTCCLEKWTYNKTIQKTCESYRITQDKKNLLKNKRRAAD